MPDIKSTFRCPCRSGTRSLQGPTGRDRDAVGHKELEGYTCSLRPACSLVLNGLVRLTAAQTRADSKSPFARLPFPVLPPDWLCTILTFCSAYLSIRSETADDWTKPHHHTKVVGSITSDEKFHKHMCLKYLQEQRRVFISHQSATSR